MGHSRFRETARISGWPETKQGSVANAVTACRQISAKADRFDMPAATRQELDARLLALKQRIVQFGVDV